MPENILLVRSHELDIFYFKNELMLGTVLAFWTSQNCHPMLHWCSNSRCKKGTKPKEANLLLLMSAGKGRGEDKIWKESKFR